MWMYGCRCVKCVDTQRGSRGGPGRGGCRRKWEGRWGGEGTPHLGHAAVKGEEEGEGSGGKREEKEKWVEGETGEIDMATRARNCKMYEGAYGAVSSSGEGGGRLAGTAVGGGGGAGLGGQTRGLTEEQEEQQDVHEPAWRRGGEG